MLLHPSWEAFTFSDVLTRPPSLLVSRPLLEDLQHGGRGRMCSSQSVFTLGLTAHISHHRRPTWALAEWGSPWNLVVYLILDFLWACGGSEVKNLPAMQETWVRSLGREDPLEKGVATHSSILAWKIPCSEKSEGLQSMGSQGIRHD